MTAVWLLWRFALSDCYGELDYLTLTAIRLLLRFELSDFDSYGLST
jgi:hypothetical protein